MIFTYLEVEIVEVLVLVIAESRRSSSHLQFYESHCIFIDLGNKVAAVTILNQKFYVLCKDL